MTAIATVAGETLELLADRGAFWPRHRMLLVADPHFGKASSFRASGVYVPRGTTERTLSRLDDLIVRHQPLRLVFLGDFFHAREGRNEETFGAIARWRASHHAVDITLVRGNHDRRAGDPPDDVGITCVDAPLLVAPFALAHHPVTLAGSYVLAGHIHPCAVLTGPVRQVERLPCFWFGADVGVLPAFGEFTGLAPVHPQPGDGLWVVAGDDVVRVAEPGVSSNRHL